ncbi:hypothetical protein [Leptolyngbya sp. GGD]|uniref:hypothetical protein n=1 Tax=Leptolyngbya sp. GGD TaxID=2997907 RepID=UPI00227BCCD4|nr:hypothetical protein [Leptolyngbya sp. GGD]MCY6490434.1 hypothetical protein [Leptolyngbya sp. GGD]
MSPIASDLIVLARFVRSLCCLESSIDFALRTVQQATPTLFSQSKINPRLMHFVALEGSIVLSDIGEFGCSILYEEFVRELM